VGHVDSRRCRRIRLILAQHDTEQLIAVCERLGLELEPPDKAVETASKKSETCSPLGGCVSGGRVSRGLTNTLSVFTR
jgi:hypothetical protein